MSSTSLSSLLFFQLNLFGTVSGGQTHRSGGPYPGHVRFVGIRALGSGRRHRGVERNENIRVTRAGVGTRQVLERERAFALGLVDSESS